MSKPKQPYTHQFLDLRSQPEDNSEIAVDLDAELPPEDPEGGQPPTETPGAVPPVETPPEVVETPPVEEPPANAAVTQMASRIETLEGQLRERDQRDHQQRQDEAKQFHEFQEAEEKKKLDAVRTRLSEAMEAGKTADIIACQEELSDLKADQKLRMRSKEAAEADATRRAQQRPMRPRAQAWVDRNAWYKDPTRYAQQIRTLEAYDRLLVAEGSNPDSDEHYKKLDAKVKERFPTLFSGAPDAVQPPAPPTPPSGEQKPRKQAPVAPAGGSAPAAPGAQSKRIVKLDSSDFAQMRKYRLDPQNPRHLKQYALEKQALKG